MPKSKIIIDDDIDFEVHIDDFEIDPDDVFKESTQPLESDAPVEIDEQNKDGPANDGAIDASTSSVNDAPPETRLISNFSVDYVYSQELEFSDNLIASTACSGIEVAPAQLDGHPVMYLSESNELAAQDADSTKVEFWFGATDASDAWHDVGDFYADEFIFVDPEVDDLIATSASSTSRFQSGHAVVSNEAILPEWFFEAQSGKQNAPLFEQDQGEFSSFTRIWLEENGGADIQEFFPSEYFDFFM